MPRNSRTSVGGICYHALNWGNNRNEVFHQDDDYDAFMSGLAELAGRRSMRVLSYCLMPNHFHLVLWPLEDGDLSRWIQGLLTTYVHHYRRQHGGSGHLWQGRFKSFPIEAGEDLLWVMHYVENNPRRARLVRRAENWAWSSVRHAAGRPSLFKPDAGPVRRSRGWVERVNEPLPASDLARIRHSVLRGTPLGSASWVASTAKQLGLESTLRPRGRPRIHPQKEEGA